MLRSVPARWFELLVPRETVARALEALAGTGLTELEASPEGHEELIPIPGMDEALARFGELEGRYGRYWPAPEDPAERRDRLLERELSEALTTIEQWCEQAAPRIAAIERIRRAQGELFDYRRLCRDARAEHDLDFSHLDPRGSQLQGRVLMLPPESQTPRMAAPLLYQRIEGPGATWLVVFGQPEPMARLIENLEGRRARVLLIPRWLQGRPAAAERRIRRRQNASDRALKHQFAMLSKHAEALGLARALGHVRRVAWLADHLDGISASEYMARIRGWTTARDLEPLEQALKQAGISAALQFRPAPAGHIAPSICANPPWARPFELFARMVGTPGPNEADPSLIVALAAPVMFGYMFGDVGHGLAVLVIGLVLKSRFPGTALMVWGGAWAMLFGLAFGSLFGREDIIPALWLHPVNEPLPVLTLPLGLGALLILLAFLLNGLEHAWAGRLTEWLLTEAGLALAIVLGALAIAGVVPASAVAAMLAAQFVGMLWAFRHQRLAGVARALGELVEALLKLVVNTLSFIRVGAFALAHAGLSLAVVSLADSSSNLFVYGLVMLIGNLLIIAIEGLVASIQTTRLLLFEFFNRFLAAVGRPFRPLTLPTSIPLVPIKEIEP
ncbi:MAG: V-type ATPase 116kDa subunit family protein [Wenzhouxiangellaceae bacterium]|nr:V-type ATPase 116kDa subunit family protein [Wenzhouxiangellaceae bacterium]